MAKDFAQALLLARRVLEFEPGNLLVQQFLPVIQEAVDLKLGPPFGLPLVGRGVIVSWALTSDFAPGESESDDDDGEDDDDDDDDDEEDGDDDQDGDAAADDDDDEESEAELDQGSDFVPSGITYRQGMTNLVVKTQDALSKLSLQDC